MLAAWLPVPAAGGRTGAAAFPRQASIAGVTVVGARIRVRRSRVMETAYRQDLHAEGLKPGQEPVQGGLILQGAVQDRFDWLHRGVEPIEVQQRFGREDADDADLIVGRRQRGPQLGATGNGQYPTLTCVSPRRPMHHG